MTRSRDAAFPWRAIGGRLCDGRWLGAIAAGAVLGCEIAFAWHFFAHYRAAAGRDCLDFTWIWLSSKFAAAGALVQAYDYPLFSAARAVLVGPPDCLLEHLDYPPTLFLFTFPLGRMPYAVAFAAWVAATLFLYLTAVYAILPRPAAVVAALTPYPVLVNILLGHDGFLTAGLLGWSLILVERRRRWPSAIALALLTYKPQFAILVPGALFASRKGRLLLATAAASLAVAAIATLAFGLGAWPAFLAALAERAASLDTIRRLNIPLVSIFGILRRAGFGAAASWIAQASAAALVAAVVSVLWAKPVRYPLKAAALAIGSLLAAPHVISYDACILTIGAAFFVRDGLAHGFLPGERAVLLLSWAGLFVLAGPVPAVAHVVLFVLVVRRAICFVETAAGASSSVPVS